MRIPVADCRHACVPSLRAHSWAVMTPDCTDSPPLHFTQPDRICTNPLLTLEFAQLRLQAEEKAQRRAKLRRSVRAVQLSQRLLHDSRDAASKTAPKSFLGGMKGRASMKKIGAKHRKENARLFEQH